jgi:hypothetical protein
MVAKQEYVLYGLSRLLTSEIAKSANNVRVEVRSFIGRAFLLIDAYM